MAGVKVKTEVLVVSVVLTVSVGAAAAAAAGGAAVQQQGQIVAAAAMVIAQFTRSCCSAQ